MICCTLPALVVAVWFVSRANGLDGYQAVMAIIVIVGATLLSMA